MIVPFPDSLDPIFIHAQKEKQNFFRGFDLNSFGSFSLFLFFLFCSEKNGFRSEISHFRRGGKTQSDQRLLAYHFWEGIFLRISSFPWMIDSLKFFTLRETKNQGFYHFFLKKSWLI